MTEYLDILLPALAVTAFMGNAIHVMYFMDHNPEVSKRTIEDSEGGIIETPPDGRLGASAAINPLTEVMPVPGTHVPLDSVLHRHYLTHLCSQLNELYPRPGESVLRRHHGQLIASQFEACLLEQAAVEKLQAAHEILKKRVSEEISKPLGIAPYPAPDVLDGEPPAVEPETVAQAASVSSLKVRAAEPESEIPPLGPHVREDHVLRRHYLALLESRLNEISPSPTDSVQRRHHQQWLEARLSRCVEDASSAAALEADYEQWVNEREKTPCKSDGLPAQGNPIALAAKPREQKLPIARRAVKLPEDSVLRRHCIQYLRAEIEKFMPRPTDSVLSRHYDQWLASEIEILV